MPTTHSRLSPLHPKVIEAIFLKREQGEMIMSQFLPDRSVGGIEFTYRYYGGVGGMSPIVDDGAATPLASVGYEEKVAKCLEIREGDIITERALKFINVLRDVVRDTVEFITERMMLRKEYMGFTALLGDYTADGQPAPIVIVGGKEWNTTSEEILFNLADAITAIKNAGHIKADSLVIGSQEENSIAKADSLIQWNLAGQFGQQQIADFAVGKLKSLDIYVTDAVKSDKENAPVGHGEALEPFLAGNALVFKRGMNLGFTAVAEPFTSRQFPIEDRRGIQLQMWQTIVPVITRPTHLVQLTNLFATP
jgi:hypothetical protein